MARLNRQQTRDALHALRDVLLERRVQHDKWGEQDHPDGTSERYAQHANVHRAVCDTAAQVGELTWRHIAFEEFYEAMAETDPTALRTELVQTAAVLTAWVEAIDRREAVQ